MQQFISRFQDRIQGVVSGFDRLLIRGSLRRLNHARGMELYLYLNNILFKDYETHVKRLSQRVKDLSTAPFREQNLPVEYLWRGDIDKDKKARQIAAERGITSGDVCVLGAKEPAPTFRHERTHMVIRQRPCLTLYHYRIDPEWAGCTRAFRPGFRLKFISVSMAGNGWPGVWTRRGGATSDWTTAFPG